MERDTLLNVMMETTLMVMDVQKIVTLKSDSLVMAVHQALKIAVQPFSQLPFQLKTEVNQDFMEKSFLMSDLTIYQEPFSNQPMIAEIIVTLSWLPKSSKVFQELNQLLPDISQLLHLFSQFKSISVNNQSDNSQLKFQLVKTLELNTSQVLMPLKNLLLKLIQPFCL